MRDEFEGRFWADHHRVMTEGLDGLLARILQPFRALHRIQWSAPWHAPKSCGPNG